MTDRICRTNPQGHAQDERCTACGHYLYSHASDGTCFNKVDRSSLLTHRITISYPVEKTILACACTQFTT